MTFVNFTFEIQQVFPLQPTCQLFLSTNNTVINAANSLGLVFYYYHLNIIIIPFFAISSVCIWKSFDSRKSTERKIQSEQMCFNQFFVFVLLRLSFLEVCSLIWLYTILGSCFTAWLIMFSKGAEKRVLPALSYLLTQNSSLCRANLILHVI